MPSRDAALAALHEHIAQAVAEITPTDPDQAGNLNDLAGALLGVFERTGDLEILIEAAQAWRGAVAGTPKNQPARATYLNNLAIALRMVGERTGDIGTL